MLKKLIQAIIEKVASGDDEYWVPTDDGGSSGIDVSAIVEDIMGLVHSWYGGGEGVANDWRQSWPQRSLPLRQRKEVQEVLPAEKAGCPARPASRRGPQA